MRSTSRPAQISSSSDRSPRSPAQHHDVPAVPERPSGGGAEVHEARHADGRGRPGGQQGLGPVARGQEEGPSGDLLPGELEGELPRSKPSSGSPRRSPRSAKPGVAAARRRASSGSSSGTMARQPLLSAVTIVVEARRTSITSTVASSALPGNERRRAAARRPPAPVRTGVAERADLQAEGVEVDEPSASRCRYTVSASNVAKSVRYGERGERRPLTVTLPALELGRAVPVTSCPRTRRGTAAAPAAPARTRSRSRSSRRSGARASHAGAGPRGRA